MKRLLPLFSLLAPVVFAQPENYRSFIVQTQTDGNSSSVKILNDIAPKDSGNSPDNFREGGSLFELFTVHRTKNEQYLLDQKVVGAFEPKAQLTIVSQDKTTVNKWPMKRTRVDKPFDLIITVEGLRSGTGLSDGESKVLLQHHLGFYSADNYALKTSDVLSTTPFDSKTLISNYPQGNPYKATFQKSTFYPISSTNVSGEEHFVVHSFPKGTELSAKQLSGDSIRVWPKATGSIKGLTDQQVIRGEFPPLTITYNNLYPYSTTRVIAYPVSNPADVRELPQSEKTLDQETPASLTRTLTEYDSALPFDGTFILEMVTTTPFGVNEPLDDASGGSGGSTTTPGGSGGSTGGGGSPPKITIVVDRTVSVRAMQVN